MKMIRPPRRIRDRVLLVAVVPVLLVTLLLVFMISSARLEGHVEALEEQGRIVARNLALTSEFPLFSGNEDALGRIARDFLEVHGIIRRIEISDASGQILTVTGGTPDAGQPGRGLSGLLDIRPVLTFEAQVGASLEDTTSLLDGEARVNAPRQPLGHVRVTLSDHSLVTSEREVVRQGLWLLLAGIATSIFLAIPIGATITSPLQRLLGMTTRLRSGEPNSRVSPLSSGELGLLEQAFNDLADETDRTQRELQDRIDAATGELNRTIRELTRKNAELAEARAEALAAAGEKEAFLARMSHEIRTPLNAIIGFSRILQQRHDGERNGEYLHIINRASTQLLFLVDDILQYSRLQAGTIAINPRRFNLTDQVEDVVAMVSHQAHEKHIELISLIHSDVPEHVEGDPERIGQILLNLLTNALKFTRVGHVFIEVTGPRPGDPPDRVCFRVTDTGSGISPEIRQNLFDPFFQGDHGITRRHGGAGLGLAIAHRLATMMGGDIEVLDRPGPGAKFQVTLPLHGSGDRGVQTPPEKADIYLYEPHPLSRRALRVMLSRHGTVVCNTGNLAAFLHQLEVGPPTDPSRRALAVVGLSTEQARSRDAEKIHRQVREHHSGPLLLVVAQGDWQPGPWAKNDPRLAWLSKPVRRTSLAGALVATTAGETGLAPPAPRLHKSDHHPSGKAKILYVEDNAFNRTLLGEMLAARGIAMDAVASAGEVDALLSRNRYGMILTDLHLPDMDGLAVARRIRDRLGESCPPVVLVTADVMFDRTRNGGDEVFDAALTKPLSEQALDEVLSRCLQAGRVQPVADASATRSAALDQQLRAEQARLAKELRQARQQGDREAMSAALHQLKGMAGLNDQTHAVALIRRLESALEEDAASQETASLVDAIVDSVKNHGNED